MKLDLGAGKIWPEGYTPMGREHGSEIYPLALPDASADVIRASHVLEHFPLGQVDTVVQEWARVLKPGGKLRIAVPDFAEISRRYLSGENQPTAGFIMGGQQDKDDFHFSIFDSKRLREAFAAAELVMVQPWQTDIEDCAGYAISLNLEATKPYVKELKVCAAMSVPRLGFMDNFSACIEAFLPLGIKLRRMGGAFWGQALTGCLEKIIEEDAPDAIMVLDYDTVFTLQNVARLMQLMMVYPDAHAIAALQSSRHLPTALFTVRDEAGVPMARIDTAMMRPDLMKVSSAHFGLTLIRTDKLLALPKPWFHSSPAPDGTWGEGHVDEDVQFWVKWAEQNFGLYIANRVVIGHAELLCRWPGADLQVVYQSMREFNEKGPPEGIWE